MPLMKKKKNFPFHIAFGLWVVVDTIKEKTSIYTLTFLFKCKMNKFLGECPHEGYS